MVISEIFPIFYTVRAFMPVLKHGLYGLILHNENPFLYILLTMKLILYTPNNHCTLYIERSIETPLDKQHF